MIGVSLLPGCTNKPTHTFILMMIKKCASHLWIYDDTFDHLANSPFLNQFLNQCSYIRIYEHHQYTYIRWYNVKNMGDCKVAWKKRGSKKRSKEWPTCALGRSRNSPSTPSSLPHPCPRPPHRCNCPTRKTLIRGEEKLYL